MMIKYFDFPPNVQLDIPVTKIKLKNNDNCTLSDQKLLDGSTVQSIRIKAVIKQETANIAFFQTVDESYVEIYVFEVIIQSDAYNKTYKLMCNLLHRLLPHHCMVFTKSDDEQYANFSLATKLISKNQNKLRVIQKEYFSNQIEANNLQFIEALQYKNADKHDLKAFYQYYIQVLQNYNLMDATQDFKLRTYEVTEQMLEVQDRIDHYEAQINKSVKELKSANQMSEKVRINSDIHTLKLKVQELKNTLSNYGKD